MRLRILPTLLAFLVVMGCTIRFDWPDHRVEIAVIGERDPMQTVTVDGTELRVDSVEVSVTATELLPCRSDDERRRNLPGFAEIFGASLAFAHVGATSTSDTTPRSVRAFASEDVVVAKLVPPADRYCATTLELGPMPIEDGSMTGSTARIVGEMRQQGASDWTPFEWRTTSRATIRLDFEEPLELGDKSRHLQFGIRPNVVQWFEGLEHGMADDEAAVRVLEAAVGAVEWDR